MARKILLADDSVTAQSMGRRILSEAGYEVVTVNNGSAALKKIAEQPPDLLILDVYMPGYGGLEVCQRLKSAEETSRIPVLLTVGKLEPFKAEEARRVRADAYLVKPFEASELLAALVKLEDKIVPRAQTPTPASFAKALAEMEQQSSRGGRKKSFGDSDSGWKDRLSIPGTLKKRAESGSEAEPAQGTGFRDFSRREESGPAAKAATPAAESAMPEGFLRGITAEEIAAITAAAAAFGGAEGDPTEAPAAPAVEEVVPAALEAATLEAVPVAAAQEESMPAAAEPAAEPVPAMATEECATAPASEERSEECSEVQPTSAYMAAITGTVHAEEIPAAPEPQPVRSFAPVEGEGIMAAIWRTAEESSYAVAEPEREHVHAEVGASAAPVRPRWIAEEVPLTDGEAADLDYEMQKARAAMADEAEAAARAAAGPMEEAPAVAAEEASPAMQEEAAAPEYGSSDSEGAAAPAVTEPEIADAVAAPAAETTSEPAVAEETPVAQAVASESVAEPEPETPTLAAAAAAGFGAAGSSDSSSEFSSQAAGVPVETAAEPAVPAESSQPAADPQEQEHEAELAQAWAQWRQIRESIASPQMAAQLADVAAAELQGSQAAAASTESQSEKDSSSDSGSPDAIASIVDSVLSELKPKIVEEIARKLGKKK